MSTTPTPDDLRRAQEWWRSVRPSAPTGVEGLWFGITTLVLDGREVRTLYLAGCPTFEADDAAGGWACDYSWWPENRFASLPDFAALDELPFRDLLSYAVAVVRSLRPLSDGAFRGAAVGFDGGDFELL